MGLQLVNNLQREGLEGVARTLLRTLEAHIEFLPDYQTCQYRKLFEETFKCVESRTLERR